MFYESEIGIKLLVSMFGEKQDPLLYVMRTESLSKEGPFKPTIEKGN